MNQSSPVSRSASSKIVRFLVILGCLAVVSLVLWQLLPKATFSSDLSQVGQGKPALVMLREIHVMGGERTIEQMQALYPEFQDQVVFLLIHTGHPDGVAFAETHSLSDGSLVLLNGRGDAVATMGRPDSADDLRRFILQHLNLNS
ncbi:hypothetical protein PHACT_11785 [Pseudohongiella acticola]|uniref:DUF4174 domain-containing protein n=1 Tax=Pseudohongiella acticola TaxID=1524254 RepID=A0A1E8CMM5_9GAMM|nr:hypothetical protein [Pseudohongiella acticola]OFE13731.1 hypothetical protein PHACT_11785 [Pseudohongiella acticola]